MALHAHTRLRSIENCLQFEVDNLHSKKRREGDTIENTIIQDVTNYVSAP